MATLLIIVFVLLVVILCGPQGTTRIYVPGPAEIWTGTGMSFLGRSESGVTFDVHRAFTPVMSDLTGPEVPFDEQWMGAWATISFSVTIFDWAVLAALKANVTLDPFDVAAADIGTPMLANGDYFRLLLYWPNGGSGLYTSMPSARNFPSTYLINDPEPIGVRNQVYPMVFKALKITSKVDGSGVLCNSSTTSKGTAA